MLLPGLESDLRLVAQEYVRLVGWMTVAAVTLLGILLRGP